jgi:hypothetical protein
MFMVSESKDAIERICMLIVFKCEPTSQGKIALIGEGPWLTGFRNGCQHCAAAPIKPSP